MSFKSRDLTVKLADQGGDPGGNQPGQPGCGNCTPTKPDCGNCTPTRDYCTDTKITNDPADGPGGGQRNLAGGGLALLRQQLRESLAGDAR